MGTDVTKWTPSQAEGRWCGFGPYYAMFPVEFVRRIISQLCPPGGQVLDPFCGRGTAPFVAQVTGRSALGADLNPVAWLYSAVKLDPHADQMDLLNRIDDLLDDVRAEDREAESEFQLLAWSPNIRGFLKSARRNLNWRQSRVDRTLMGAVLVHLHGKTGEGLSNQLRQSKAMAPDYSVRWWRKRDLRPPELSVRKFFKAKLAWRYQKGIPLKRATARVRLGDSRKAFAKIDDFAADLILTSPPYCGVTNYEYDNWMRYWMLGGPHLPSFKQASRFTDRKRYRELLLGVLRESSRLSSETVRVYLRTSAQRYSTEVAVNAIREIWPDHRLLCRFDKAKGATQTALFGNDWKKLGEVDLLALPARKHAPAGFEEINRSTRLSWL